MKTKDVLLECSNLIKYYKCSSIVSFLSYINQQEFYSFLKVNRQNTYQKHSFILIRQLSILYLSIRTMDSLKKLVLISFINTKINIECNYYFIMKTSLSSTMLRIFCQAYDSYQILASLRPYRNFLFIYSVSNFNGFQREN